MGSGIGKHSGVALSKHHSDCLTKKQRTLRGLPLRRGARLGELEQEEQCRENRSQGGSVLPTA